MPARRYTVHVDQRGRFVLPADVRRDLAVDGGGLIVLDVEFDHETVRLRKAVDVARSARGLLRDLAPDVDLAAELIEGRRAEAERESAEELAQA
jgi:bifunctional DNA-binding transcriptional regulator/antitoxin component of YhaV-PrlF toxin-antitoxin module